MARRLKKRISTGRIGVTPDPRARIGKTDLRLSDIDAIQERASEPRRPQRSEDGGELDHAPWTPPLLIGGEVKFPEAVSEESRNDFQKIVLTERGPKIIPSRIPMGNEKTVIDWCSFTVSEQIIRKVRPDAKPFSDEEFCQVWSDYCVTALLRLKCSIKPARAGMFGYDATSKLGEYGIASTGALNGLHVSFTGHAFDCADSGFPQRLHDFLQASNTANITRLDIAFDDEHGELFPVRKIPQMWQEGRFTAARSPIAPKLDFRGDWSRDDPDQRGLTANIGSRDSGKVIRAYEKGRQLGDRASEWVRVELELRSSAYSLVPDMLINPTSYFVMAAPALTAIEYAGEFHKLERIATQGLTSVQKLLDVIRHQYGGHLHVLRTQFFESDSELLDLVTRVPATVAPVLQKAINLSNALAPADPVKCVQQATTEK